MVSVVGGDNICFNAAKCSYDLLVKVGGGEEV